MPKQTTTEPVRAQIQTLLKDLATLRDELKLQAHLGKMELHDRLVGLEKRHADLDRAARNATAGTEEHLHRSASDLAREVRMLRKDAGIDSEC
jgi:hypothetical protein